MTNLLGDLRYAFRSLRKAPVFTAVAVLSLALGIGANTAIFTLLDQILLRLLPVKDAKDLSLLRMRGSFYGSNWGQNAISYPMYRDFKEQNKVFTDMFCRFPREISVNFEGHSELSHGEMVSGTYFPVLGVGAALGRTLSQNDDVTPSGHPVAVLSYDFWQVRFAGDPQIVGKKIVINGNNFTIVGVAQQGFDGVEIGRAAKVFVPIMMQPDLMPQQKQFLEERRTRWVHAFGRRKPGLTDADAKNNLQPIMHQILEREVVEPAFSTASAQTREDFLKNTIDVLPGSQGRSGLREQLTGPLWVLMAITGTVLLIACANLANLLLARATGRYKEMAIRLAMGAGRGRIISQLLTESLVLAGLGGAAGVVLALWADQLLMLVYLHADSQALSIKIAPDARILLFTIGVTLLTGLLFGLAPALQATNPDVAPTLKDQAGAVVGGGNSALRKALVSAQVTLSLLLLIGAGLFVKSLNNLRTLGPGFNAERLIGFEINPVLTGHTPEQAKLFYRSLTENIRNMAGVQSVGLASVRLLAQQDWSSGMQVEGYVPPRAADHAEPDMNNISPNYFATMGIPLVAGRDFTDKDSTQVLHAPGRPPRNQDFYVTPTIIVNETFVRKYFAGRNAIGRHVGFGIDPGTKLDMEIIGVVKDVKYDSLRNEITEQAFIPYLADRTASGMTVYVRTAMDANQMFSALRAKVREMDASLPIYAMRTTEDQINESLSTERLIASLSAVFGFLATLLATIGLYGVMAYTVARRTREIGIRMALGAAQGNVVWMVMKEVLVLVGLGVGIGLPAALALTRLVQNQLFGIAPNDPSTLVVAAVGLAVVACAAGYIPALRASRVDPIIALRYQ